MPPTNDDVEEDKSDQNVVGEKKEDSYKCVATISFVCRAVRLLNLAEMDQKNSRFVGT